MRPMFQAQTIPVTRSNTEHVFTPYSYAKQNQIKSPSIHSTVTSISSNHPQFVRGPIDRGSQGSQNNINSQGQIQIQGQDQDQEYKKVNKPMFSGVTRETSKQEFPHYEYHPIRKEESQPDLRTTCPNVLRKFDQTNIRNQQTNLRNTTHNVTKLNAVINEVRKNQEEEQRNMKKNGVAVEPLTPTKGQSPFMSMTQSKKTQQKSNNFRSLNEMWSTKVSNAQKPKKNIINGFQIYKQLGKGKFGEVYLGRHIQTGFIVALKKVIKAKVIEYKMLEQFKRQIRLHSALDHPNIVKFYGFFQDGENIYLILQYISGGTLFDYLAEKDTLTPKQAAQFLKDTIEALNYMHDRSIAHRDIKPQNIVLTAEKVAKLCDFGWSALVQSSRTTYCGTFDYAPPEILERKNYDTAVDIWCIGVLTFQLLTGKVPFEGEKRKQIMDKILSVDKTKINYPPNVPEDAKNFIQLLVQKDPNLRPKCKDLLKHLFFVNHLKNTQNYKQRKF